MGGANKTPTVTYKNPAFSPVSTAGWDDAIDPAIETGKQVFRELSTAASKRPIPANLKGVAAGGAVGIAAESMTQNVLDAMHGGKTDNPYIANLERLGSRVIGGATSGGMYAKSPAGIIPGVIGGAALDIGENVIDMAKLTPEIVQLMKDRMETNRIENDLQKRFMKPQKFVPIREAIKQ
jgi:hypothetical protein